MHSQVENGLYEDVELQGELWHALDVLVDEHKTVDMPSQSNVKSIVTNVEVGESAIFKSALVSELNGNPALSKDRVTQIKVVILYMKPKLLITANHDTILNLGCDCGVFVFLILELSKKKIW